MADANSKKIYYSMGEVSEMMDVNPSLIRFWEQKFDILKPHKNKKGNRMFTPADVDTLKLIYHLVKERGMTLEGAARKLKAGTEGVERDMELMERLQSVRALLLEIRNELREEGEVVAVGESTPEEEAAADVAAEPGPEAVAEPLPEPPIELLVEAEEPDGEPVGEDSPEEEAVSESEEAADRSVEALSARAEADAGWADDEAGEEALEREIEAAAAGESYREMDAEADWSEDTQEHDVQQERPAQLAEQEPQMPEVIIYRPAGDEEFSGREESPAGAESLGGEAFPAEVRDAGNEVLSGDGAFSRESGSPDGGRPEAPAEAVAAGGGVSWVPEVRDGGAVEPEDAEPEQTEIVRGSGIEGQSEPGTGQQEPASAAGDDASPVQSPELSAGGGPRPVRQRPRKREDDSQGKLGPMIVEQTLF